MHLAAKKQIQPSPERIGHTARRLERTCHLSEGRVEAVAAHAVEKRVDDSLASQARSSEVVNSTQLKSLGRGEVRIEYRAAPQR